MGFAGGSGDFPLSWDPPIPPGISVSIGVDIASDWNHSSGVWVYECDGVGFGDKIERGLIGEAERSASTSLASL